MANRAANQIPHNTANLRERIGSGARHLAGDEDFFDNRVVAGIANQATRALEAGNVHVHHAQALDLSSIGHADQSLIQFVGLVDEQAVNGVSVTVQYTLERRLIEGRRDHAPAGLVMGVGTGQGRIARRAGVQIIGQAIVRVQVQAHGVQMLPGLDDKRIAGHARADFENLIHFKGVGHGGRRQEILITFLRGDH